MNQISHYLFSVIATVVICSLIYQLSKNLNTQHICRFICGIILAMSVLRPIVNWKEIDIDKWFDFYTKDAKEAVAIGKELSYQAQADIIKQKAEAYILDKAKKMGADITVSVSIANKGTQIPVSAEIHGNVSAYTRECIEKILNDDLGIARENQQWNG